MPQSSENTGSSLSIAQTLTCPSCGREFEAELWLIVDAGQRLDLVERIRAGQLHELPCPHCGEAGQIDAPLLVYRPDAEPPLLFSPASQTSGEQDREHAVQLVGTLRQSLGEAWQDDWLAKGLHGVSRDALPALLSDDPEAAVRELQERAAAEFERLRQEDPERYREAAEAARQAVAAASPLLQGLQRFLEAPTWFESQRIVEQMPELLGDEADLALGRFIQIAHTSRDEAAVTQLLEHRDLLRHAREAGIARAFAEKALLAEGLAAATTAGLTPEEFLETQRAAAQMPPELRAVLQELAAEGTEIRSPEDLQRVLAERPGLQARLAAALQAQGGISAPAAFQADLQRAQEGEQRYLRTGDQAALDAAATAWQRILDDPAFAAANERFQHSPKCCRAARYAPSTNIKRLARRCWTPCPEPTWYICPVTGDFGPTIRWSPDCCWPTVS